MMGKWKIFQDDRPRLIPFSGIVRSREPGSKWDGGLLAFDATTSAIVLLHPESEEHVRVSANFDAFLDGAAYVFSD